MSIWNQEGIFFICTPMTNAKCSSLPRKDSGR